MDGSGKSKIELVLEELARFLKLQFEARGHKVTTFVKDLSLVSKGDWHAWRL